MLHGSIRKTFMSSSVRLSGLQKDVLNLYRKVLRQAEKTSEVKAVKDFVRAEFRKKAVELPKSDFRTIEHNMRSGQKFIKLMSMPGFRLASSSKR